MTEWFERWFGEEYLALYPHRDEREAERVVALLERLGVVRRGATTLDLACGAGRFQHPLAQRGVRPIGLDLSMPLLRVARRAGYSALVRGDIRGLPLRSAAFDAVLNLFTSFGYFESDDEHALVIGEVARILKPGGRFVLDFLNAPLVKATLVPRDEREVSGRRVVQERRLSGDGRFVIKTITRDGDERGFMERVRLFEREELERLVGGAGLAVRHVFGDYDGGAYSPRGPRCLVVAERA